MATTVKKLTLPAAISVKDLADRLGQSGAAVVKYLMTNGVMASMNQTIDFETAALVADSFGFEAESEEAAAGGGADGAPRRKHPLLDLSNEDPAALKSRAPVVTVLGHVDHGKTSLLDAIRKTKVAAGEAGGITQVIRAHQVTSKGRPITFIDTPGHAAFTEMRRRGADVTDIAVLVVAADDGIMPQTEEAIQHAKAAGVPIVVALNKVDKEGANTEKVLTQLAEHDLAPVKWGGKTEVVETSAKKGTGIDTLLETILLVADAEVEPKANPDKPAVGAVIESNQDPKSGGVVATILVQQGTLRVRDPFVVGTVFGRVRALFDDAGHRLEKAGPSTPVLVSGLSAVVDAGEILQVMPTEREARALAEQRLLTERQRLTAPVRKITLADLASSLAEGDMKKLNLVLKAEANGSLEALKGQILQIEDPTVQIKVVGDGVGPVSESDVNLAAVTGSIVIGFNVRPDDRAKVAADDQGVDVRYYDVVYQVTDDIEKAVKGLYEPTFIEVFQGRAEVRKVYTVDGKNAIAGSNVTDGKFTRNAICKVLRGGKEVHKSKISALKRFKDDVREVAKGYDCGITLEDFAEFEEGDLLEAYVVEQQNL